MDDMTDADRMEMMKKHHRQTLWVWWSIILLGVWLMTFPATFGYAVGVVEPAGGRWLPFSLSTRIAAMTISDLASGFLLIALGWRCLTPGRAVSRWLACFVGIWLQWAPLAFWSPTAAGYLNDTFVGVLVIALTILIPGMPAMMRFMKPGPQIPPGWTHNPSSWPQRGIMIALAFGGWLVSRYLATYQMGYIATTWDPFFGAGAHAVLTSKLSDTWPVSDGGLGAFAYTFEFLMGWMGSPARWRTMPWMVLFFGILVVPLGLTHIFLVMSQPVIVGQWCSFCLLAAILMLPMIPLSLDEVFAMVQFMHKTVKIDGKPFWRTFWKGGTIEGGADDSRTPPLADLPDKPLAVLRASLRGMSAPWTLTAATVLGVWMMAAPGVFGTHKPLADSSHLAGALVAVVAVVAMAEVVRPVRWINAIPGLWIAASGFLLAGGGTAATINALLVGLAIAALAIPAGPIHDHYGPWDRWIRGRDRHVA